MSSTLDIRFRPLPRLDSVILTLVDSLSTSKYRGLRFQTGLRSQPPLVSGPQAPWRCTQ